VAELSPSELSNFGHSVTIHGAPRGSCVRAPIIAFRLRTTTRSACVSDLMPYRREQTHVHSPQPWVVAQSDFHRHGIRSRFVASWNRA
jgi:hypothetical protein